MNGNVTEFVHGGFSFFHGFGLLFWVLVIFAIVVLFQTLSNSGTKEKLPASNTPLEILEFRFAQGEIDELEFNRMKKELK